MDKVYESAKDKIDEGLTKLNAQPLTAENARQYKDLTEALYYLVTATSMMDYSEEGNYSGNYSMDRNYDGGMSRGLVHMPDIRVSRDGRIGMDGDNDGRYNESRRRTPERYYYSGHMGKEHMMEDLKAMYDDADSEKERRRIKDLMEDLKELKGM